MGTTLFKESPEFKLSHDLRRSGMIIFLETPNRDFTKLGEDQ